MSLRCLSNCRGSTIDSEEVPLPRRKRNGVAVVASPRVKLKEPKEKSKTM